MVDWQELGTRRTVSFYHSTLRVVENRQAPRSSDYMLQYEQAQLQESHGPSNINIRTRITRRFGLQIYTTASKPVIFAASENITIHKLDRVLMGVFQNGLREQHFIDLVCGARKCSTFWDENDCLRQSAKPPAGTTVDLVAHHTPLLSNDCPGFIISFTSKAPANHNAGFESLQAFLRSSFISRLKRFNLNSLAHIARI